MPKRAKGGRKRKGFGKRKLAACLFVVAGIVLSLLSYGLVYRGVVDFTFGSKNGVRQSYELNAMSQSRASSIDITHILLRNSGSTGIAVIVTLHAVNAVVSVGYDGPYSNLANAQIYLPAGGEYQVVNFYLTLPQQVQSFTLRVTVGQVLDFSNILNLVTSGLALIQPTSPTTLVYVQEPANPTAYELTNQY